MTGMALRPTGGLALPAPRAATGPMRGVRP